MMITMQGMGFSKKFNVPSGSTIEQVAKKLEDKKLNAFYVKGQVVDAKRELKEGDVIMAMSKSQKIDLGCDFLCSYCDYCTQ